MTTFDFAVLLFFLFPVTVGSFEFTVPLYHGKQLTQCQQTPRTRLYSSSGGKEPLSSTTRVIRFFLDQMQNSPLIEEKHAEHCESKTVTHLFKGTPLVNLPDEYKLQFVDSWAGKALATVMAEEQVHLGDWKVQKILEAAGEYNEKEVRKEMQDQMKEGSPILMYSFVDCPWCIAAKALLDENGLSYKNVELEPLGRKGKAIRAELGKWTGRTSLPSIFVNGKPIGGFTDGIPCGSGLQPMYESGELFKLLN